MFRKEGNNIYWFLPARIAAKFAKLAFKRRDKYLIQLRKKVKRTDFTIVANNCLAGTIYHDLGLEFRSPFIDMFISPEDFFKIVSNFEHYTDPKLEIKDISNSESSYPIGLLDDVKLVFVHYKTFGEANDAWKRRVKRINYKKILFLMSDTGKFVNTGFDNAFISNEILEKFLNLEMNNFYFLTNDVNKKTIKNGSVIILKKYLDNKSFYPGAIELFGKGTRCFEKYFNVLDWINRA